MKINESKLQAYIEDESILEYDTTEEYIKEMNIERLGYPKDYPNEFKTLEDVKKMAGEYQFTYKGKVYSILFDEALDVYED